MLRLVEAGESTLSDEEIVDAAIEALERVQGTDTPLHLRRAVEAIIKALRPYRRPRGGAA